MADLRFGGSVWCNIDVALRNLCVIYSQEIESLGLTVIEWYILRLLYEHDKQMASRLSKGVERAATSFTPLLDKLATNQLIASKRINQEYGSLVGKYGMLEGRLVLESLYI
ncbi:MAG: hypothetical protein H0X30_00910 [Anaerolineae bacterium]|nr:hypothetical protein [Anaerolineae bacterium]